MERLQRFEDQFVKGRDTVYFSERLAKVDPEGFLREVHRWENVYTVEQARLSLFYVLLAKYRYYDFIGNDLRKNLTDWELCRLGRVMDIDHPFLSNKSCKQFKITYW